MTKVLLTALSLAFAMSGTAFAAGAQDRADSNALRALDTAPVTMAGATSVRLAHPPNASATNAATAPAALMSLVTAGPVQAGLPCFGCAGGSQESVGLTLPIQAIVPREMVQYSIVFTDFTYNGTCKVAFAVANAGGVLDRGSFYFSGLSAGTVNGVFFNRSHPANGSGTMATMLGRVTCGTAVNTIKTYLYVY